MTASKIKETQMTADPMQLFQSWLRQAASANAETLDLMVLSTVSPQGHPSSRVVLLKGIEDDAFVFFTNYLSKKGQELASNPFASAVFLWPSLGRQVRIEGQVEKATSLFSDQYWRSRPRESQISGTASPQSQSIPSLESLEQEVERIRKSFQGRDIPRPLHWGGYRLIAYRIEFWSARENRLHHRSLYLREATHGWRNEILAP